MSRKFSRLVRFLANDNQIYYGEAAHAGIPTSARIITGDIFGTYDITDTQTPIKRLLCPLAPSSIRTVRGIGLNYRKHAAETGNPIPKYPILFHKPSTAITGPLDPIIIPHLLQTPDNSSDYEAELVVVMGREAKDVEASQAMTYVLGFTAGNDVSHRAWQMTLGGTQWSFSKGFDASAPIGPQIVVPGAVSLGGDGSGGGLRIRSRVEGEARQDSSTDDLIFSVAQLVSFLSQGTTLMPGDVIFTGTPEGVGMGRTPKQYLKDGEVVEVEIEGIGKCMNQVVWETKKGVRRAAKL